MKPVIQFFIDAEDKVYKAGFEKEIKWVSEIPPFEKQTYENFFGEYVWVVLNAGMREQVARKIYYRFLDGINYDVDIPEKSALLLIGHEGKREAIRRCSLEGRTWFSGLKKAPDKIEYLQTLPWIGKITKYHLARNLGIDVVKPDRHLIRLAKRFGYADPTLMCIDIKEVFRQTKLGTIDLILWRYCNLHGSGEDAPLEI